MSNELLTPGKGKFRIKRVKTHEEKEDEYTGEIKKVPLETKKGDRKVLVIIDVTDSSNKKGVVFEHLTMNVAWKVEAIFKACNLGHLFVSDALCLDKLPDIEGGMGECIIGRQEADGQWPEKTIISKYVVQKESKAKAVADEAPFLDDDIPF